MTTPLAVIGFPIAIGVVVFFGACAVAWGRDYIERRSYRRRIDEIAAMHWERTR